MFYALKLYKWPDYNKYDQQSKEAQGSVLVKKINLIYQVDAASVARAPHIKIRVKIHILIDHMLDSTHSGSPNF